MEGVPFVGNDACAHNLLLKGRPLIMRFQQLPTPRGVQGLVFRAQYLAFFARKAARLETSVLLLGIT